MVSKIEATIGIAKCPHSGQLYGVRIEINGSKWTATWAFPIKPDVAKREGYSENQFPAGLLYTKEYPGCPYCKKVEDLVQISKPKVKKTIRVNVSSPCYDDIGKILTSLKINHDKFSHSKFNCDLLFLNCGTSDFIDPKQLRDFVSNGGCVYASDLTDTIISSAFPSLFNFKGHIGEVCTINADVVDRELKEIVGNTIRIEFDMPVWAVLNSANGSVLLKGSAGSKYSGLPIMVKVPYGKGVIFYTCFHNHAQASEKEQALLQLLVLKQIGSSSNLSIEDASAEIGVDIKTIKAKFRSNW